MRPRPRRCLEVFRARRQRRSPENWGTNFVQLDVARTATRPGSAMARLVLEVIGSALEYMLFEPCADRKCLDGSDG